MTPRRDPMTTTTQAAPATLSLREKVLLGLFYVLLADLVVTLVEEFIVSRRV